MVPAFSQKFWKIGMTHMRLKNPDDGLDIVVPLDIGKGLKEMCSGLSDRRSCTLEASLKEDSGSLDFIGYKNLTK